MATANENDATAVDEWTTIQKPSRRRRPERRRRNRNYTEGGSSLSNISRTNSKKNVSKFLENAISAQLKLSIEDKDAATHDEILRALNTCLQELEESEYWKTLRQVLQGRIESNLCEKFGSIVCYGIGNFGTKRPSAPMWQLGLAMMIRDFATTLSFLEASSEVCDGTNTERSPNIVPMHYFEPLMTTQESIVLENLGVQVIEENERGKRAVQESKGVTLFFMPHCPMSLYTNLFHTNWDTLPRVIVFGNSLDNYIDRGNTSIVTDPQKQQALQILETLQPFWKTDVLKMTKKDIADRSAYFEQAFNDSSFTSFTSGRKNVPTGASELWPTRPHLDSYVDHKDGEVI